MNPVPVAQNAFNSLFHAVCDGMSKVKIRNNLEIDVQEAEEVQEPPEPQTSDSEFSSWNERLQPLVTYRQLEDAWNLIDEMKARNVGVDFLLLISLIKFCEAKKQHLSEQQLETVLAFTANTHIDPKSDSVLVTLYNVMLDAAIHSKNTNLMYTAFTTLMKRGFLFPPSTFGNLIKAFGNIRDFQRVLMVWDQLQAQCKDNFNHTVSLGCMLDACVKCNRVDKAIEIFQATKQFPRNTILCATMIKAFAKTKDLPRALALKEEMDTDHIPLNLILYNSLIDVCVRCDNLPMAALFLREMHDWNIAPDIITFSTLIKGYCQNDALNKALLLVQEAKSRNLKVDEIMFNSLLDGCATAKSMQLGMDVFQEMISAGIMPSCVTFSILVRLYVTTGHLDAATDLVFRQMKYTWKVEPNSVVYTMLYRFSLPYGDPYQVGPTLLRYKLIPERQLHLIRQEYQEPKRNNMMQRRSKTQWAAFPNGKVQKQFQNTAVPNATRI